ncbi:MAG: methyltransferase domain-containing protein [Spirochaetota bacterium]
MKTQIENIQQYYGSVLQSKNDLKTGACCTAESMPEYLRPILNEIHPEILDRFYGCGSPIPLALEGATVLDLGCGTGRDAFMLSKLVGESGRVIGLDMTEEQLAVARKHNDWHANKFGYSKTNVELKSGYMEDLAGAGIADNSVDLVVSNCVINLSPDKGKVFSEILRVLKPGGELYFSDVFADRRIPEALKSDPVLLGECLSGAMYTEDFRRMLVKQGIADFRVVKSSPVPIIDKVIERKIGMVNFTSLTIRAFKLDLEDKCEDYGQVAYYKGTLAESPHEFMLDDHHLLKTGMPFLVCGNTAKMLSETRYAKHFQIIGDTSKHFGLFDCKPAAFAHSDEKSTGACC